MDHNFKIFLWEIMYCTALPIKCRPGGVSAGLPDNFYCVKQTRPEYSWVRHCIDITAGCVLARQNQVHEVWRLKIIDRGKCN